MPYFLIADCCECNYDPTGRSVDLFPLERSEWGTGDRESGPESSEWGTGGGESGPERSEWGTGGSESAPVRSLLRAMPFLGRLL